MAKVTLTINSRHYTVGCEDGQEAEVDLLGRDIDRRARALANEAGAVSDELVMVLVSLLLADEAREATKARDALVRSLEEAVEARDKAQEMSEHIALEADQEIRRVADVRDRLEADRDAALSAHKALEASFCAMQQERDALRAQLEEARQALESARLHLEQRRDEQSTLRLSEENFVSAIEHMAKRVETVAQTLLVS